MRHIFFAASLEAAQGYARRVNKREGYKAIDVMNLRPAAEQINGKMITWTDTEEHT